MVHAKVAVGAQVACALLLLSRLRQAVRSQSQLDQAVPAVRLAVAAPMALIHHLAASRFLAAAAAAEGPPIRMVIAAEAAAAVPVVLWVMAAQELAAKAIQEVWGTAQPIQLRGGGGGKSTVGADANDGGAGNGGDGITLASIGWDDAIAEGAPSAVGGGGGGGSFAVPAGTGGLGGGGDGMTAAGAGLPGDANTGGGGGGSVAGTDDGGAGGSGLVVVRWI